LRAKCIAVLLISFASGSLAVPPVQAGAPNPAVPENLIISLQDALARARQYGTDVQLAKLAEAIAREDVKQANAARLPSASGLNQYIYTEGNGTPSGVFVANDGVHVYNEQLIGREDLLGLIRRGQVHAAEAADAVARAQTGIAARGLNATVIQDYYAVADSQRKLANAQTSLNETQHFLDITQKLQRGGEAAHADVIKARILLQQRQRDMGDAALALQKAKLTLAVLIFPAVRLDYSIVDDLDRPVPLPPLPEAAAQVTANSPDLAAAHASINEAHNGVTVARYAYLPSFDLEVFYGIDANQFDAVAAEAQATGRSTLPNYLVGQRQNLGYSAQATLTIPLWDWGAIHSRVKQASLREQQAKEQLSLTERQVRAGLLSAYGEARTALSQVDSLRSSTNLAAESLRLTLLRYEAGEATALEVSDAETTASQARAAYDDGLLRYRVALANLGNLTGVFPK
jgi:outer membrane protein TolC